MKAKMVYEKIVTFNCSNYYQQGVLIALANSMIEKKLRHKIYIDCIGFTRAHNEGWGYVHELKSIFKDNLNLETFKYEFYDEHIVGFVDYDKAKNQLESYQLGASLA